MEHDIENPFLDELDDVQSDTQDEERSSLDSSESTASKPWERDYTDEERQELNRRAASGELLPGRKRRRSAYSRRDVTDIDLQMLTFIAQFKYATDGPLATFAEVQRRTAYRRMMGLREMKLVHRVDVPGARRLWVVSDKGRRVLEDTQSVDEGDVRKMRPDEVTLDQMGHNLAIAQTAAWLTRGMPKFDGKLKWMSVPYALDALTSEFKIRQGWDTLMSANSEKLAQTTLEGKKLNTRGSVGTKYADEQFSRAHRGEVQYDRLFADAPSLWTLSNANHVEARTMQFHYPDLVLNHESKRSSIKPESIAFEIELSVKNQGELARIMRMYKADRRTYKGCVWVVGSPAVKRHIESVAKEIGYEDSKLLVFVPLFDSNGHVHDEYPWKL